MLQSWVKLSNILAEIKEINGEGKTKLRFSSIAPTYKKKKCAGDKVASKLKNIMW